MSILISLIILVAFVAVAVWLIRLLPLEGDLAIIKKLLILIVVIVALLKLFAFF